MPHIRRSNTKMPRSNFDQPCAGNGKHKYTIHLGDDNPARVRVDEDRQSLLQEASPVLAKKFAAKELDIKLAKFDSLDFETYCDWLHACRLNPCLETSSLEGIKQWHRLVQAYLLGEELEDHKYCNAIADTMILVSANATAESTREFLSCVGLIFSRAKEGSPAPTLMVDLAQKRMLGVLVDTDFKDRFKATPEIWYIQFIKHTKSRPDFPDTCQYHLHGDGESCQKTETSMWAAICNMYHDYMWWTKTNLQGIRDSFQAFRPCISSTSIVLGKLGKKYKSAFSWLRKFFRTTI